MQLVLITAGVLYGNSGNDSCRCWCSRYKHKLYGGAGNDSLTIGGAANTLTYEGGVGADSFMIGGAVNSTTIYGDNASATEGGDDSISIAGTASGSYIYANSGMTFRSPCGNVSPSEVPRHAGNDSVSCWLYSSTVYGGER